MVSVESRWPSLGTHEKYLSSLRRTKASIHNTILPDFEMRNYTQTLDHFNFGPNSYDTFLQRYAINFKYWGGANTSSPIFVYIGDEGKLVIDKFTTDFLVTKAPHFKSLLVFIEHRYYGQSNPFGSMEEAYKNSSTLQYLSSEQALADCAQLITDLKKNLSAENSPVIAVGGSYGGMLAAWLRLKYPHITIGALASSAPILYFDDITAHNGYCSVVSRDFRESSESCYRTIKNSWHEIKKTATQYEGLTALSQMFNTCRPLTSVEELTDFLEQIYFVKAQYDTPFYNGVNFLCEAIDKDPHEIDPLRRIASGFKAINGISMCLKVWSVEEMNENDRLFGWRWQACTEMVMPIDCTGKEQMFEESPFNLTDYMSRCKTLFNVLPRPHWITTEYDGRNIKEVLKDFGSNIIFSNGLRDPYSSGGVLQNISSTIVAVTTTKGSHCLDIAESEVSDPDWLISQRNMEVQILDSWIAKYNSQNYKS
ncbi:hypothetical protein KSP39_PZI009569 [Platanthera zijinensis]|uniref:Lysosomal Pro-X carboxypeptidase n=1 Tax=Platanthera zijinensis TaxID=2320716 RepID=A0AAP0G7L8_9ASPA